MRIKAYILVLKCLWWCSIILSLVTWTRIFMHLIDSILGAILLITIGKMDIRKNLEKLDTLFKHSALWERLMRLENFSFPKTLYLCSCTTISTKLSSWIYGAKNKNCFLHLRHYWQHVNRAILFSMDPIELYSPHARLIIHLVD